jgi:hypothetical protein
MLIIFSGSNCYTQDSIIVKGQFLNNSKFTHVIVQKFGVGVYEIAASPINKETGEFRFNIPPDVEPGERGWLF